MYNSTYFIKMYKPKYKMLKYTIIHFMCHCLHCALTQCELLFLVKIPSLMPAAFQNGGGKKIPLNPSLFVKCSTLEWVLCRVSVDDAQLFEEQSVWGKKRGNYGQKYSSYRCSTQEAVEFVGFMLWPMKSTRDKSHSRENVPPPSSLLLLKSPPDISSWGLLKLI